MERRRFPSCSAFLCHSEGGGGGGFSVAGLVLLNSTSERENVRLFLHIFVVSLQPDEPAHVVALTLQQRQRVSARQAPGEALASCGP